MRLPIASLGLKLNLSLLLFFVIAGGATWQITLYGFDRTQSNATAKSQQGLEDIGQREFLAIASDQADFGTLQLEWASDAGQMAARYLVDFKATGAAIAPYEASKLTTTADGARFDPDPNRHADLVMPNFASLTPAALQDMTESVALDAIAPSIFTSYPGRVRGANFDAIAFFFTSVNQVTRYYPVISLQDIAPPDTDLGPRIKQVGPEQNPERKTYWTTPYEDKAGHGTVITAYTSVYDGDTYRGIIGIDLSLARLIEQIRGVKLTQDGFAFYVDRDGDLLRSDSYDRITHELDNGNTGLAASLEKMRMGKEAVDRVTIDGKEMFVAYAPLSGVGGSFGVAGSVDEVTAQAAAITGSIRAQGDRTLVVMLLAMLALFIAGLMTAGWLNRRVLLRPIEALVDGTRAVAGGDLDTTLEVSGRDELSVLANSFNQMTADIRSRRDALRQEIIERRHAQEELRALFAAMTDIVLVIDRDGRFVRVPRTSAPPKLIAQDELPGKTLHDVMPQDAADAILRPIQEAIATRQTITVEQSLVIEDAVFWFSAAISPMSDETVVVVAREITDRVNSHQELERRVEERTRELRTILQVSTNVASTLDLQALLELILEQIRTVADYSRSSIFLLEGDSLVMLNSRDADVSHSMPPLSLRIRTETIQPIWDQVGAGSVAMIDEMRADTPAAQAYRLAMGDLMQTTLRDIRCWMGIPLMSKDRVIGMLTVLHTQPAFYDSHHAEVLRAIALQAAIAIENARLYEQAQQLAAVEERQHLARELHDSVSQALYGIALGARTARTLLDQDPARAVEPIDYVLSLAEAGLAEMRALIFELRPESLELEGLVAALEKQVKATSARYGIRIDASLGSEPELELAEKEVFYRIGQEVLHNIVKHARATTATVYLNLLDEQLVLAISDNGIGFDPNQRFPGHMGLVSMDERAANIGATIRIESAPGAGTTVRLALPVARFALERSNSR